MRLFSAVRHSADPNEYYGGLWSGNFYPALRQLGHEIVESEVDLLLGSRFMHIADGFTKEELAVRSEITQRILDEIGAVHEKKPIDLFLSYFYNSHFDPAGFDELRRLGIPSINFYCNSIYQFENVAEIAKKADFSWHPEKEARDLYLSVGARPVWVQMGADPGTYRPIPNITRKPSACFVGQCYADRDRWVASLIRAGVSTEVYGAGWTNDLRDREDARAPASESYLGRVQPRPGTLPSYLASAGNTISKQGLLSGTARLMAQMQYRRQTRALGKTIGPHARGRAGSIIQVFAEHEVCLNFSNVWADGRPGSKLIPHVRLRDFEAPMCRTCYLTGHTDEIGEFYEVGKEIDTYRTAKELISKVRFYLENPRAAEALRESGYRRARRDHTWKERFEQLFRKIDLN